MEVQKGRREASSRMTLIRSNEHASGVWTAEALEIHGQESNVGTNVVPAQCVREFEAVENSHAVVEAENIRGLQVAVAITDLPICDSGLQE